MAAGGAISADYIKNGYYELLGVVSEYSRNITSDSLNEIKNLLTDSEQLRKAVDGRQCYGFLLAISRWFVVHINLLSDQQVYSTVKSVVQSHKALKQSFCAAIDLLQRHIVRLANFMTKDFEMWHRIFSTNMTEYSDVFLNENKCVREVSVAFYQMGTHHAHSSHLQRFCQDVETFLASDSRLPLQLAKCFINYFINDKAATWSGRDKMFYTLVYLFNQESRGKKTFIGIYLECLTNVVFHKKTVCSICACQETVLIKFLLYIIKNYPSLQETHELIASLHSALLCIYNVKPALIPYLVSQSPIFENCLSATDETMSAEQYLELEVHISLWQRLITAEELADKGIWMVDWYFNFLGSSHPIIYDCFMKQTFEVFEKMDLSNFGKGVAGGNFVPLSSTEQEALVNSLIYLIDKKLNGNESLLLMKMFKLFSCKILKLSVQNPYISGIFRILTREFESKHLIGKFESEPSEEMENVFFEIFIYALELLNSKSKSNTLKVTLFKLLSILPGKIVVIFLNETIEIFIEIFKWETFDPNVVLHALLCLENWLITVDGIKMKRFLETISPNVFYFIQEQCECTNVPFKFENKVSCQKPDWFMIKQKLATIFKLNGELRNHNVVGLSKFSMTLAFPRQMIKVDLSYELAYIIQASVNPLVEESIRIQACQSLYVVATSLLVQCANLKFEELKKHIPLFEKILYSILKLGYEGNPALRTLCLQTARAVSSEYLCESFAAPFINVSLCVVGGVQELAATCVQEFMRCFLKKRRDDGVNLFQPYVEVIMLGLSDNRSQFGARKLLSRILPELIEDGSFLNKYYVYVIYSLIYSLNLSSEESENVDEALVAVCDAVKKSGPGICQDNISRMKPISFKNTHLLDLLSWLLKMCYAGNARCRASSMKVYELLRNVCLQEKLKTEQSETLENLEVSTIKKGLMKIELIRCASSGRTSDTLMWMKLLLGLLECYNWLVTVMKMKSSHLNSDAKLFSNIEFYIDTVCSKDVSCNFIAETLSSRLENQNVESLKTIAEIKKISGSMAMKVLQMFTIMPLQIFIHSEHFSKFLLCCVTQPATLGIELNEHNDKLIILFLIKIVKLLKESAKELWGRLRDQIVSPLMSAYCILSDNLAQILSGKQPYIDRHIGLISGMKYLMAVVDSNEQQEIIIHLKRLPFAIKDCLKEDGGAWLRHSQCTRGFTADLVALQFAAMQYQQVWDDLTHCNCQIVSLENCVCQIYFELFIETCGQQILRGCDQIQFGNLCSNLKLTVINQLLLHFKFDLLNRFLCRLKVAIIAQSKELMCWAGINIEHLIIFTNALSNVSSYEQQMTDLNIINDSMLQTHFERWIFNLFKEDVPKIDFIPLIIYFSADLFKSFLLYINESSKHSARRIWNNLLLYFDVTENERILYNLLKYLNNHSLSLITESFTVIVHHLGRLSANCQLLILQTAHQISINQTISFKHRTNFVKQFYLVLLQNMDNSVTVQHYQNLFQEMYSYDKTEIEVDYKVVMLQLLEVMFRTLERSILKDIVLKCEESTSYSSVVCELISRCYGARKELQNGNDCEQWRMYQCASFNCLITLLPQNYDDNFSHNFFLFREKSNESSTWDSLVDRNTSLIFPVYKNEISAKYYSLIQERRLEHSAVSCTPASMTQHCKLYDFVGQRTTMPSKEKYMYTGFNLELDSLNEHECMGPICALITSIGSADVQANNMPGWMKSFNNCLRNPNLHVNTSAFLIKIVFNTRNIFHNFAKHWLGPILYAINNGTCGSSVNHFYCQIVSMLVSWHNVAVPEANSYEGKCASNIVALLTVNIVGKDKKEAKRNYQLLSSCLMKWKDSLKCSIETIIPIISFNDAVELKTGIDILLSYLKNKVMPYRIKERNRFFTYVVNLCQNLLQSIYKMAFELIGLFLVNVREQNGSSEYEQHVKRCLVSTYNEDKGAFVIKLEKVAMYNGEMVDRQFVEFLTCICLQPKLQPVHSVAIDILCKKCYHAGTEFDRILSECGIFQLLSSRNENYQLNILKLCRHLCENNLLLNIDTNLDLILNSLKSENFKLLATIWDLLVLYARKSSIYWAKVIDEVFICRLLDGIWSHDQAVHLASERFLVEVVALTSSVLHVFTLLLDHLTDSIVSDRAYITIILEVILEIAIKSPNCNNLYLKNVFECDYQNSEFENIKNWNIINGYKICDYPYVETTYGDIANLLQNLGKADLTFANRLLIGIVNSLLLENNDPHVKQKLAATICKLSNMGENSLRYCLEEIMRCNQSTTEHNDEKQIAEDEKIQEPPRKWPRNTD